jgi:hypothetical protein
MKIIKIILTILLVLIISIIIFILILRFHPFFQLPRETIDVESVNIYQAFPTPGSDIEFIESDANIKILSSASEIHAYITGGNEIDTFVRFNLPSSDLSSFLESTLCQTPLTPANPQDYQGGEGDQEWWQPANSTSLSECEGGDSYTLQRVLVDKSNDKNLIIYVLTLVGNYSTPTE